MRIIRLDGSPESVSMLAEAVADALNGGPAVLPLGPAASPPPPASRHVRQAE